MHFIYFYSIFLGYCLQIKLLIYDNYYEKCLAKTVFKDCQRQLHSRIHSSFLITVVNCKHLFQSSSMEILPLACPLESTATESKRGDQALSLTVCMHEECKMSTHMLHSSTNTSDTPLSISVHVCVSQWHITMMYSLRRKARLRYKAVTGAVPYVLKLKGTSWYLIHPKMSLALLKYILLPEVYIIEPFETFHSIDSFFLIAFIDIFTLV